MTVMVVGAACVITYAALKEQRQIGRAMGQFAEYSPGNIKTIKIEPDSSISAGRFEVVSERLAINGTPIVIGGDSVQTVGRISLGGIWSNPSPAHRITDVAGHVEFGILPDFAWAVGDAGDGEPVEEYAAIVRELDVEAFHVVIIARWWKTTKGVVGYFDPMILQPHPKFGMRVESVVSQGSTISMRSIRPSVSGTVQLRAVYDGGFTPSHNITIPLRFHISDQSMMWE
ncbi:MAG: hypothetical protein WD066_17295 [Planctomycetaceae bacterium]